MDPLSKSKAPRPASTARKWIVAAPVAALALGLLWIGGFARAREWTDATGKFKIQAELERVSEGKVYLRGADGKSLKPIPIDKLSQADQDFLKTTGRKKTPSKSKPRPKKADAAKAEAAKGGTSEAEALAKLISKADSSGGSKGLLKWDMSALRKCRYKTLLTLKVGEHSTTIFDMEVQLNTATVAEDGMATVNVSNHKVKGSYKSPTVEGSFDSTVKQEKRDEVPEGPAKDVGSALYIASWMTGGFGMQPNGAIRQNGQSEFIKLDVSHPEAVQITSVLNSQALMRIFSSCLGPLPTDPLVEGSTVTWTKDWTSPLTAPDRMPPVVPAQWSYKGHTKDGDELYCEFPAAGQPASPTGLAGTQTIVFDSKNGRLHSAKLEFSQKVQIAEQGSEGLPVKVNYDVTFLKVAPAPRQAP